MNEGLKIKYVKGCIPNEYISFCSIDSDILPQKIFGLLNYHHLPAENFTINTNKGYFDSRLSICTEHWSEGECLLDFKLQEDECITVDWGFENGIVTRKDTLVNNSRDDIIIYDYKTSISFKGEYEMYSQLHYWCYENQGRWEDILHGVKSIQSKGGRTCIGASPYLCIREKNTGNGIAVHLVPRSDWKLSVEGLRIGSESPHAILEAGFNDPGMSYHVKPGESVLLSELVITELPDGKPEAAAPILHTYMLQKTEYRCPKIIPIEYNTWIFEFDRLDEHHLLKQLEVAKEIGCEVFTIDAGWYGQSEGNWIAQIGDWREKLNGAFYGKMKQFANKVRMSGLKFGIWIEPERYGRNVPVVQEHPEWFIDEGTEHVYPDLQKKEAYDFVYETLCNTIDRYDADWIKLDFNNVLGRDPYGMAHAGYLDSLYRMVDRLQLEYPGIIIENCASGGMRLDLESFKHYDIFFPTDTTNPIDMLRICEGASLRMIPGRLLKWLTLKNVGPIMPVYPKGGLQTTIITPGRAGWPPAETVDLDFAAKISLCGQLAFTGDLGSFDTPTIAMMKRYVAFAKEWRNFIYNSVAFPLTEVKSIDDRKGFSAIMFTDLHREKALIFSYRLDSGMDEYCIKLPALERTAVYELSCFDDGIIGSFTGEELLQKGVALRFIQINSGKILILKRVAI
jgi:Alpha-galactosidase